MKPVSSNASRIEILTETPVSNTLRTQKPTDNNVKLQKRKLETDFDCSAVVVVAAFFVLSIYGVHVDFIYVMCVCFSLSMLHVHNATRFNSFCHGDKLSALVWRTKEKYTRHCVVKYRILSLLSDHCDKFVVVIAICGF